MRFAVTAPLVLLAAASRNHGSDKTLRAKVHRARQVGRAKKSPAKAGPCRR